MFENRDQPNHKAFQPDYIANSVATIDFDVLVKKGVKAIMIDLDGTVVSRGKLVVDDITSQALKRQPLNIYIATNRPESRDLGNLKDRLNASGVVHPKGVKGKPFPHYYKESLRILELAPTEVVMVGDRYLQDIYGANKAGLTTLLVRKLDLPVNWFDRWLSGVEKRRTEKLLRSYRQL
jgi:HAD superfamily phosphatase (TIGR01668 family)